ncbi:MAG: Nif3-like dinuclear metal center hexameric protein [Clostridia bacterium]|nr:Nif3-like dinuclear metal center hexameric protein [Clostridia bacterium]
MLAKELIAKLTEGAITPERTCDTIKAGEEERELHKVAVTMFATVDILKEVSAWGADMLIVHEPTYYDHMDVMSDTPVTNAKKELIEKSGLVIYRFHDHAHFRPTDLIPEGEFHYLGLTGKLEPTEYSASSLFTLDTPITALELAKKMQTELGIAQPRIAGDRNCKVTRIGACFGTPKGVLELLQTDGVDIVLTGEACEWKIAEYARDAAALGMNKALIVMGHIGSERDGMRLLVERMKRNFTEFETRYFECGEVYSYV